MIGAVETWLFQTLTNDAALMLLLNAPPEKCVRAGTPDRGQQFPVVEYNLQAPGADDSSRCGGVELSRLTYQVKVIGRGVGAVALQPFWDRLDALLTGAADGGGGFRWNVIRETPIRYTEVSGSDRYTHYGGLWAFEIRSVA